MVVSLRERFSHGSPLILHDFRLRCIVANTAGRGKGVPGDLLVFAATHPVRGRYAPMAKCGPVSPTRSAANAPEKTACWSSARAGGDKSHY